MKAVAEAVAVIRLNAGNDAPRGAGRGQGRIRMRSDLDRLCEAKGLRATVTYGVAGRHEDPDDEWKRMACPWTVMLRYHRRCLTVPFWQGPALTDEPTAADVLSCLISDATSVDRSFEEWAADFGMDADSRKAERTYRACERMAPKVRQLLGDDFEAFARAQH